MANPEARVAGWLWMGVLWIGCNPVRRIPAPDAPPVPLIPAPMAQAHYLRGQLALLRGDLVESIDSLQMARVFDPKSGSIPIAMGKVHLVGGDIDKARSVWEEAVRVAPDSAEAWVNLARADRLTGDLSAAAKHYRAAIAAHYGWAAHAGLIDVLERAADVPGAKIALARWVESGSTDPVALAERGQRRLRLGDAEGARQDLAVTAAARPEEMAVMVRWVEATRASGRYGSTLDQLWQMHRSAPRVEAPLWALSVLSHEVGALDWQVSTLNAWIALAPANQAQLELALSGALVQSKRPREALQRLDGLAVELGETADARWWSARALLDLGRVKTAAQRLGGRETSEGADWATLRAEIAWRMGDKTGAEQLIRGEAAEIPGSIAWSRALLEFGELDRAWAVLQVHQARFTDRRDLVMSAVDVARAQKNHDGVVALLAPWITNNPEASSELRYRYAEALWASEGADAAKLVMRDVYAQDLGNVGAMTYLAKSLAQTDPLAGLALARRAVDRAPADPLALSALGWLAHLAGDASLAERSLMRATVLQPENLDIRAQLRSVQAMGARP